MPYLVCYVIVVHLSTVTHQFLVLNFVQVQYIVSRHFVCHMAIWIPSFLLA